MYSLLAKRGQLLAFLLGLFVVAIFIIPIISGIGEFNLLSTDDQKLTNIFNPGLVGAVVLIVVCALAALVGGLFGLIANPKGSLKLILGLVGLVVVFFILYSMSAAESTGPVGEVVDKFGLSDGTSKFVSAGLKIAIILIITAFISFIVTELWNLIK